MVPSPKVPTYDKEPDMSALEVADEVCTHDSHQPSEVQGSGPHQSKV